MQTILYPKPQYARVRCAVSTTIFSASLIFELDDLRLSDAKHCDRPPPLLSMNRLASFDVRFDKFCVCGIPFMTSALEEERGSWKSGRSKEVQ